MAKAILAKKSILAGRLCQPAPLIDPGQQATQPLCLGSTLPHHSVSTIRALDSVGRGVQHGYATTPVTSMLRFTKI